MLLFAELRKVAAVRRMGLQTDDLDVYLWGTEEVPYVSALQEACQIVSRSDSARMSICEHVAKRLLGPLHLPAVQKALGCLIPEWI